jgi:hypothetical protein
MPPRTIAVPPTLDEFCRDAEARLQELRALTSQANAGALAQCEAQLHTMACSFVGASPTWKDPGANGRVALYQLQRSVRSLGMLLNHGNNLCLGWVQLCSALGYTNQGQPVLATAEPSASYEA